VNARRIASLAGTVAVTVIAAVGSYDHMRAVALGAGQSPLLAALLPLSVDGMILVATLALGDGRRSKVTAWVAFLVGVAASLAANVMAAAPDAVARTVSAWPAVALLLTVEVLARSGRSTATATAATAPATASTAATAAQVTAPATAAGRRPRATSPRPRRTTAAAPADDVTARVAALLADRPTATVEDVAAAIGRAPRTARRYVAAARAAMAAPAVAAPMAV
jgi:hypothetical protein